MRYRVIQIEFFLSCVIVLIILTLFLIYRFTDFENVVKPIWFLGLLALLFLIKRQTRLFVASSGICLATRIFSINIFSKELFNFGKDTSLVLKEDHLLISNSDLQEEIAFKDFLTPLNKEKSLIASYFCFPPYLIASHFREFVIETLSRLKGARINEESLHLSDHFEFRVDSESRII